MPAGSLAVHATVKDLARTTRGNAVETCTPVGAVRSWARLRARCKFSRPADHTLPDNDESTSTLLINKLRTCGAQVVVDSEVRSAHSSAAAPATIGEAIDVPLK